MPTLAPLANLGGRLTAAWLGLILLAMHWLDARVTLCPLRHLTALPCPTCGLTRGSLAILHGHPLAGWMFNPLAFTILGLMTMNLLGRALLRRRVRITLTARQRHWTWAAMGLIFLANWAWLIVYHKRGWM